MVLASTSALFHSELCQSRSPLTLMVTSRRGAGEDELGDGEEDGTSGAVAVLEAGDDAVGVPLPATGPAGDRPVGAHAARRIRAASDGSGNARFSMGQGYDVRREVLASSRFAPCPTVV